MENSMLLNIWSNDTLSYEDKISLSKEFAKELKEKQNSKEHDETYDKYNDNQKPIVKKAREQAAETRKRLEQANYDGQLKERMEILSYLKNDMGVNQYSKNYLKYLSGFELNALYEDNLRDMPEAMKKAKEERARAKEKNETIFDDYKLGENGTEKDTNNESKKRKTIVPRLEDNLKKMKENNQDENLIVKEEDGSKFTKVKVFLKKHWKKVLLAAGIIGGVALTYNLIKQGQTDSAHDVTNMIDTTARQLKGTVTEHVQSIHDQMSDLGQRTDVGNIDTTFYTNDDAVQNINNLNPNEYHQNHILGAVTDDNVRLPADNMQDVYNYADQGKHITSLEVGGYNDATGTVEIDGHVNMIDGVRLEDDINNYQSLSDGGKLK